MQLKSLGAADIVVCVAPFKVSLKQTNTFCVKERFYY